MKHCELHRGRIKLGGYKGGRGYCGHYTTSFGKRLYLRSTQEFVYAKYLDSIGKYYLTENIVYSIDGKNYKPDFFVYAGKFDRLEKIVEVKYTVSEKSEYQKAYAGFFGELGIGYEVLSRGDIKGLIRSGIVTKDEIKTWKDVFISQYEKLDFSGKKNPMYGVKHSDKTKRKIGERTRQYFRNPDVRKRHHDARVLYWRSDLGSETKKKYAKLRAKESIIKNPIITQQCMECGKEYTRKLKDRYHKETCSNSCQQKYNWRNGKNVYRGDAHKAYKSKIKQYFKKILGIERNVIDENYDNAVRRLKAIGEIPSHFGMNLHVIKKYFGSLACLRKEIK